MEASPAFTPLELTEANLRQASLVWIEYRNASTRAANGNAELLVKRNNAMARVNYLLDSYLMEMAVNNGTAST